jgi:hypothetical protein
MMLDFKRKFRFRKFRIRDILKERKIIDVRSFKVYAMQNYITDHFSIGSKFHSSACQADYVVHSFISKGSVVLFYTSGWFVVACCTLSPLENGSRNFQHSGATEVS